MRRILSLGLAILTLLVVFSATATAFDGGNGSEADPYQIATAADLINLGQTIADYDKHFILTADIDLSGYSFDKAVIAPDIDSETDGHQGGLGGVFCGKFDGDGHSISNLTIDASQTDNDYLGLFGYCNGENSEIKNLGLISVNIIGGEDSDYVGGLCGYISYTSVDSCFVTGNVNADDCVGGMFAGTNNATISFCHTSCSVIGDSHVGGLSGFINYGLTSKCYTSSYVEGYSRVGGFIGYRDYGEITACFSYGIVEGSRQTGGFIGQCGFGSTNNCYSNATVIGQWPNQAGGFCGYNCFGNLTNCYSTGLVIAGRGGFCAANITDIISCGWDIETSGYATSRGGIGLTTAQMQDINSFLNEGWDFVFEIANGTEDIWTMKDYPVLAWQNPNEIYLAVVVGETQTSAEESITDSGFIIGDITFVYDSTFPSGTVKQQSIFGLVDEIGLIVDLVISLGKAPLIGVSETNPAFNITPEDTELELTIDIYNAGGNTLDWFIDPNAVWIKSLSPLAGTSSDELERTTVSILIDTKVFIESPESDRKIFISDNDGYLPDKIVSFTGYQFDSGDGTETNPYQINTAEQLISIGSNYDLMDKHFILTADIDLSGYTFTTAVIAPDTDPAVGGCQGSFRGTFNGNGKIISNLTIDTLSDSDTNNDGNDYLGLFGQVSSYANIEPRIFNLGLENVNIISGNGSEYIGSMSGDLLRVSLANCYASGSISLNSSCQYIGGFCGHLGGLTKNCYANVAISVSYSSYIGGFCGYGDNENCNCYSIGNVNAVNSNDVGGFCGKLYVVDETISCFWDIDTSGQNTSAAGTGLTTADMQNYNTFLYAGWDFVGEIANGFDDIWVIGESGYPEFLWQYPDAIVVPNVISMTLDDAQLTIIDAGFTVGDITYGYNFNVPADVVINQSPYGIVDQTGLPIDLIINIGSTGDGSEANPYQISSAEQLIAIGSYESVFDKHFILVADIDLSAYTFTTAIIAPNIFYTNDNDQYIAFNGSFNGNNHIISNLTIDPLANDNNSYLGLFGKTDYDAQITNLGLENVNIIAGENSEYIGGICGYNCGEIHNSFVTGNIEGDNSGGICGINYGYFAFIEVNYNHSPPSSIFEQGIISNCYSECDVSNGICKFNDLGIINNCYTIGAKDYAICEANPAYIFRHTWYEDLGFFLRPRDVTVNIDSEISSCFWDTESSEATTSAGGTGLPTAQMQNISTYLDAGWDFAGLSINGTADIWYMPINDYPILRWQDPDADMNFIAVPDIVALTEVQWQTALTAVGLVIGDINYVYSETVQAGMIISQYPAAGQAAIVGDAVDLVVSLGKSPAIGFGNLVYANDMPDTTATLIVSFEVFNAGENTLNWQVSDPNYLNAIIAPESGNSLYPTDRTTVTATFDISMLEAGGYEDSLIISDTDGILADVEVPFSFYIYEAIVPDIISMNQVQAQTAITEAELVLGEISFAYSPNISVGLVMTQSLTSNTFVQRGSLVDIIISLGQEPAIGISDQSFNLNVPDHALLETISFEVFNVGYSSLDWQIASNTPWIVSINPETGTSSAPNDRTAVTATLDVSSLEIGNHSATLTISDTNGVLENITVMINLNLYRSVNLEDFAIISQHWLTDCPDPNNSCGDADWVTDGKIDLQDLTQFLECWLTKIPIVTTWYQGDGTEANPYQVSSAQQLINIGNDDSLLDKHFIMTADIDLAGYTFNHAVIGRDIDNNNTAFQGVGFSGIFDGNGYTISNLTIKATEEDHLGLFGCVYSNGKISNLGLESVNIVGGYRHNRIGGIAGWNYGIIIECYTTGCVSGGGLAGFSTGEIFQCYSTASVSSGGLVTYNGGIISQSFATGAVRGDNGSGGGLAGGNNGTISQSYATGSVSGDSMVGGLVGCNQGTISQCYATGYVYGNEYVRGLVGYDYDKVESSFWDIETSGQSTSDGGTGLNTAAMQNIETYLNAGWDFVGETANGSDDIWQIPTAGGYPILYWQE
ncbi:MAG: PASTA domain-containing protein [Phycisphaerae bacterium]|nr:PASTA domain-containing protein [Phycisphaerae bacterium]